MSEHVRIPYPRPPINGGSRSRAEQMAAHGTDVPSNYNPLNDDTQSQPGSTHLSGTDEILARLRELELQVFGSRHQPGRGASTSPIFPRGSLSGAGSGVGGFGTQFPVGDTFQAEPDKDWKKDVKRWKRVQNKYGSEDLYDESEKIEDIRRKEQEIRSGGYVLSVYDDYDLDGKKINTFLRIHSGPLVDLLREVITFYPGNDFDILSGKDSTDDTITFPSPFMIFLAYWQKLHKALEDKYPKDTLTHLKMLLDFIKVEHPVTTAKVTEIDNNRTKKISYDKLWLLYPPNTPVYSFKGADERQVVVYAVQNNDMTSKGPSGANRDLIVKCWEVVWVSRKSQFEREFRDWVIHPYSGEKSVQNLELVPARFVKDEQQVRERLIARGRHYFGLNLGHTLQDYYGDRFPRVFHDEGVRVVVDDATYFKKNPARESSTEDSAQEDYGFPTQEESLVDNEGKPLDTTFQRCFPKIGVFSLRNKEWALVKVDDLKPVAFRPKAFKRLVIDPENKQIIKAMVEASKLEKPGFSDIVSGKGRGLTVLLHGPPGTGKTLTAECVAEKYERPLFTISCGDLGTTARDVESNLKEVFQLAVTWKAILLLDEADIFLQERDMHNIERNALVSVFLRELDYFEGILFLSTNRPGEIDEAFVSRVHITLGLNTLTKEAQHQIWGIFIRDLTLTDRAKRELLDHVKKAFKDDQLNGRQIRNAVRTALALAQLHDQEVGPKHLDRVMKPMRNYAGFLRDLNGADGEAMAFAQVRRGSARAMQGGETPEDESV